MDDNQHPSEILWKRRQKTIRGEDFLGEVEAFSLDDLSFRIVETYRDHTLKEHTLYGGLWEQLREGSHPLPLSMTIEEWREDVDIWIAAKLDNGFQYPDWTRGHRAPKEDGSSTIE